VPPSRPAVFRMAITEPTAIDPYRAQEIEGIGIVKLLFVGLLDIVDESTLTAAVARTWECTPDGTKWTFHLRDDVRFSDGEPVDAASFVRGVNRALDPAANTETSYHVAGVRGYAQVKSGERETLEGLSAPDPTTLVVQLDQPDFEFAKKTLQPIFSPVPTGAGPAINQPWNDQPIGNGPFMMRGPWRHGESIQLERNPHWFGDRPWIEEIHIDILDSAEALGDEYAGFESGRYDFARIPAEQVVQARERYQAEGGFLARDLPGLHYLIPFCHQAPLDSPQARRAVSLAIDRQRIAEELFGSTREPATSLLSPWFGDAYSAEVGAGYVEFDLDAARLYAKEAGLVEGTRIDLAYNTGAGHDRWTAAIGEQLRTGLGLDVRLLEMTGRELLDHRTSAAASGLCRAGWAYDYPTPDNLLFPLLHSSCTSPDADGVAHGDNEGRYVSAEFDAAVDHARSLQGGAAQAEAWRAAERIAVADLALIPLWYRTEYRVFAADRFTGLDLDFFGNPTLAAVRPPSGAA
jgi:oligopeptide transport system substrate-binding protein